MNRADFRFSVGTRVAQARTAALDIRGRLRTRPPCASVVPRPRLRRRERGLRLTHALLASDLHPSYVGLWPLTKRAWAEIAGLEPVLVLVAASDAVPAGLKADPAVHVFEPLADVHTAFQAQCIRLLYPALLRDAEGVVISDVDMAPLNATYLRGPVAQIPSEHFVSYRDVLLDLGEIPICYNAALPSTWSAVFGIRSLADVRTRLAEWSARGTYAGVHGGDGWTTDQLALYETLLERGRRERDVWILDDHYTRFRRLDRAYVEKWGELSPAARDGIRRRRYSDFHLLAADSPLAHLNGEVIDFAISQRRCVARRGSRARARPSSSS